MVCLKLNDLPLPLLEHIVSYLNYEDSVRLMLVNKNLFRFVIRNVYFQLNEVQLIKLQKYRRFKSNKVDYNSLVKSTVSLDQDFVGRELFEFPNLIQYKLKLKDGYGLDRFLINYDLNYCKLKSLIVELQPFKSLNSDLTAFSTVIQTLVKLTVKFIGNVNFLVKGKLLNKLDLSKIKDLSLITIKFDLTLWSKLTQLKNLIKLYIKGVFEEVPTNRQVEPFGTVEVFESLISLTLNFNKNVEHRQLLQLLPNPTISPKLRKLSVNNKPYGRLEDHYIFSQPWTNLRSLKLFVVEVVFDTVLQNLQVLNISVTRRTHFNLLYNLIARLPNLTKLSVGTLTNCRSLIVNTRPTKFINSKIRELKLVVDTVVNIKFFGWLRWNLTNLQSLTVRSKRINPFSKVYALTDSSFYNSNEGKPIAQPIGFLNLSYLYIDYLPFQLKVWFLANSPNLTTVKGVPVWRGGSSQSNSETELDLDLNLSSTTTSTSNY